MDAQQRHVASQVRKVLNASIEMVEDGYKDPKYDQPFYSLRDDLITARDRAIDLLSEDDEEKSDRDKLAAMDKEGVSRGNIWYRDGHGAKIETITISGDDVEIRLLIEPEDPEVEYYREIWTLRPFLQTFKDNRIDSLK